MNGRRFDGDDQDVGDLGDLGIRGDSPGGGLGRETNAGGFDRIAGNQVRRHNQPGFKKSFGQCRCHFPRA